MAKNLTDHNYFGIDATIIADSKNEHGNRITSFVVTFPRMILAEFNTHRLFSRNSASSRAIPTKIMFDRVANNPFIPIAFQKTHKGMQGNEYLEGAELEQAQSAWLLARDSALSNARLMDAQGITKQLVNRVIEPFLWHTVIVTSTEYENYFNLRDHEAAEIHIADLAAKMKACMAESTPNQLKGGEWHIPFGDSFDQDRLDIEVRAHFGVYDGVPVDYSDPKVYEALQTIKQRIAIARCARVSYGNFDGSDDYAKDLALFDRLSGMGHWSPFEHVARAMTEHEFLCYVNGCADFHGDSFAQVSGAVHRESYTNTVGFENERSLDEAKNYGNDPRLGWCRNMKGFIQLRAEID